MTKGSLTRRELAGYTAAIGAGAVLATQSTGVAAASPATTARPARTLTTAQDAEVTYAKVIDTMPASFAESPMLTELVKAGTLPELKDRLPEEPLVVQPIEIGQYGGTARVGNVTTTLGGYDCDYLTGREQHFLRYTPDLASHEPNIAKSVDVSDDKTTYTIHMRKGLKWSDGEPCTSADLVFSYQNISLNKDITPSVSMDFRPGGTPAEVSAPDDYTVVIKFAVPHPRFLLSNLPHRYGWYQNHQLHPAHYLKQFHPDFNPKAEEESKAAKFNTWVERFSDMDNPAINPDRPALSAFTVIENTPTVVRYQRNPYFWQVDAEGNQLPYIDYVEMERLQNVESYHAKIVTGAYDYSVGNTDVLNFQTYDESAEAGDYNVGIWSSGRGSEVFFQLNLNIEEEALRTIHQDVRFRRALSLAINRDEMNELLFFGQATIRQMTVLPTSIHFKQEYADAFIDYDVDQANALLDEMGLAWNDSKSIRLRSDGKPLQYTFSFFDGEGPKASILELVAEYWRAIGLDVTAKSITRQLLSPRITENKEAMSMWHGDASTDILLPVDRKWSIGKKGDECTIAPVWNDWFQTDGASGEEPPEWYKEPLMAWKKFSETLDPDAAAQLLQSQADNLWSIGTVGLTPWLLIAKNHLANVPTTGIHTWDGLFQYPYHAETIFFRQ